MCAYAMLASMSVSILVFAVFYQLNQLPTPVAVQPAEVITLIQCYRKYLANHLGTVIKLLGWRGGLNLIFHFIKKQDFPAKISKYVHDKQSLSCC